MEHAEIIVIDTKIFTVYNILILLTFQVFLKKMQNRSFLLRRSNSEKVVAQELMKLKRIPSAKKVEREKRVSTLMAEVKKKLECS
jgi:hypothetical protein